MCSRESSQLEKLSFLFKMKTYQIQVSNMKIFKVDADILEYFPTIQRMIKNKSVIQLLEVNDEVFFNIFQWITYHKDDMKTLDENNISKWDTRFFLSFPMPELVELLIAANLLEIQLLIDFITKTLANMIEYEIPETIRKIFNISYDFTSKKMQQIKREHAYIFVEK